MGGGWLHRASDRSSALRRAIDTIFGRCAVVSLPGCLRPWFRVADLEALVRACNGTAGNAP
jgi:hypothetical protein